MSGFTCSVHLKQFCNLQNPGAGHLLRPRLCQRLCGQADLTDTLGHWDVEVTEGESLDLSDVNFVGFPDPNEEHKVGDSLNYEVEPVGGEGPFEYAFYVFKDGTRVDLRWYTGDATFSYAPKEPGNYQVQAFVKDATGKIVRKAS